MLSYLISAIPVILFLLASPPGQFFVSKTSETEARRSLDSARPQLNESLLAIDDGAPQDCSSDAYAARVLSRQPLVIYLEGFLSLEERSHLLSISEPLFEPSTITHDSHSTTSDPSVRNSLVALLPRTDTVRCIESRARSLQGWRGDAWLERLRTQRYETGGHYAHHFDWSGGRNVANGWDRVSSFMVWVDDGGGGLEGGGTEFPLLRGVGGGRWCEFVVCEDEHHDEDEEMKKGEGTVFKVIPGNAVFWENFGPDGRGYEESWHAGLPVTKGSKVGLNIWTYGRIH